MSFWLPLVNEGFPMPSRLRTPAVLGGGPNVRHLTAATAALTTGDLRLTTLELARAIRQYSAMDKPLRILHLEDEPDFSTLVSALIEREGLNAEVVLIPDFASFTSSLEQEPFDIVIADYMLPTCNGLQALQWAKEHCPQLPFILLSGAIGEHAAIDFLRGGATDYVLKSGLERLVPAIRRAIEESQERSQLKVAEAEAREGERQYRLIFEQNPVPMWISDLKTGAFVEVNEAAVRHYGYSRAEFLAMTTKEIGSPEEAVRLSKFLATAAQAESESAVGRAGLCQHRHKDGAMLEVEILWWVIRFQGREELLTMANDVTELKQAIEALRQSEASLTAAQRIVHMGSWEMELPEADDLDNCKLHWSDETYRIFGYEPRKTQASADLLFNLVHPDDRDRIREAMQAAIRSREPYDVEHRIVRPDGEERVVRERAEFVSDEGGKSTRLRGIVMDLTDRKQLEERLRQSQKMKAIGQLAGGVAHDFNNILTVTHGHALLLLGEKSLSKSGKESAQAIAQAAERAAGLTRSLLAFSRRQVIQLQPVDLNELINSMTMMLGRILGEDIALQLKYSPEPAVVQADSSMMDQVLLNLVVNARDAMPKGGKLAVEVAVVDVGSRHLASHPEARAGKFACLSVVDSGTGITPANLRRIFEPFFTTKEDDQRTGFGLATVYGIVKQHQGWIEAESELGKGATFRVYIPVSKEKSDATSKKPAKQAVKGGDETILVVEDEAPVLELVSKALTAYGYNVLQAVSGTKAMDVWKKSKSKIDLLLTDVVLPDQLNGRELAERLKKAKSKLKVIYSSGYSPEVIGKDIVLQKGQFFLQKPYDLQKLAVTVRTCLDGK